MLRTGVDPDRCCYCNSVATHFYKSQHLLKETMFSTCDRHNDHERDYPDFYKELTEEEAVVYRVMVI